jgi:prepilin peptidase CpaA
MLFAGASTGVAAVIDWRTGRIPNWLSLGSLGTAVLAHLVLGGWSGAGWSLVGMALCALVPLVFWQVGGFGGGDVKMLAAIGAGLLPIQGIEAEFYAFIAVTLVAPIRLAWQGRLLGVLANTATLVANPFLPKARRRTLDPEVLTELRLGPALLAGVAIASLAHWGR